MEYIKVNQVCDGHGGYRPVVEAEIMSSHAREKGCKYKMHLQVKLDELSEITSL